MQKDKNLILKLISLGPKSRELIVSRLRAVLVSVAIGLDNLRLGAKD